MDTIIVQPGEDISSLWEIIKNCFPSHATKFKNGRILEVSKQYLDEFCRIFSIWYHQEKVADEVNQILAESFVLTKEEESELKKLLPDRMKEEQSVLADILYQKLQTMLKEFQFLNLKGFCVFCMNDYRKKLETIIDECLEEYLTEKDYHEFLNLLQYFVEVEDAQFGELTVVADINGKYHYYDQSYQNISTLCMNQFYSEFEEENPTAEDCLITVLILMLPERIAVYGIENIDNDKFLNTLKTIFGKRIEFHTGTEFISKNSL